ncbi:MAG: outer membrane lipoprotein chaperone LolA [Acidobacteriota bacterium]|nr:outer membrane lipoprotein chaperone LolA [Acidobacteriota bacterium]
MTGFHRLAVFALAAALPAFAAAQTAPPASTGEIAAAVQRRYNGVRDFTADFTHTYQGGVLRQKTVERGTLEVKKPGRMRWAYTSPEKKEFVSDGSKLYSYLPADRQVIVSEVPPGGADTTAALFLAGRGDLTRDFTAALDGQDAASYRLKLTPKRKQQEFDTLTLVVSRATMQITSLVAQDQQGGTSIFVFSKLKENVGLADSRFAFAIPRGVEVVRSGGG